MHERTGKIASESKVEQLNPSNTKRLQNLSRNSWGKLEFEWSFCSNKEGDIRFSLGYLSDITKGYSCLCYARERGTISGTVVM